MFKELLTSILFSSSLCAAPLEVSEEEMPALPNESSPFRGKVNHSGYVGHTWVGYPHVENPASLDMDPMGRIFVAEANRFWFGVPDLRRAREMIREDFQARTIEDRLAMYDKHAGKRDRAWYTQTPDRLIRLEDRDGNGVADYRTLFSDAFKEPLDGIGFSILAERNATYFTCIPALRKLTDPNDDGVADTNEKIVNGFGVRVSFIGHDLHGITRGPDGRLYFTVGDRGFHVVDDNGTVHEASGRGAVFRCDSNGSNFEVYAHGLRNPQELAFDNHGNLFTFDNTGDIGDKARVVYVLDNSDSGWDMSHQSPHHYANALDWGDFHLSKSVWVGQKMFETYTKDQPQWVYPPIAHVGNGPSGVTWLSGMSVAEDLRDTFLMTNYRGAANISNVIQVSLSPDDSSFKLKKQSSFMQGVAVADVEHGYDGNLYFADYGGGWSVNKNGSIQVLRPTDAKLKEVGAETARIFQKGFAHRSLPELVSFLEHPDQRARQASQFAMVDKGAEAATFFSEIIRNDAKSEYAVLHALWGLGQLYRQGVEGSADAIVDALSAKNSEIRANAARVAGDAIVTEGQSGLLKLLEDSSSRVVSLSAIALGRVAPKGDDETVNALFAVTKRNQGNDFEVTIRHSLLSALDRVAGDAQLSTFAKSEEVEQRLLCVLLLRRRASPELAQFLDDANEAVREEAVLAIYDTDAMDGPAGQKLLLANPKGLPFYHQARLVGACFRIGSMESAVRLSEFVSSDDLDKEIRGFAIKALMRWATPLDTDPVLGHYRPVKASPVSLAEVVGKIGNDIKLLLEKEKEPKVASLLSSFAQKSGLSLDSNILRKQVANGKLDPMVRVANLKGLISKGEKEDDQLLLKLTKDENEVVRAASFGHLIDRALDPEYALSMKALKEDSFLVARSIISGLILKDSARVIGLWRNRELDIRPELWLDLYLVLLQSNDSESKQVAATYAAGDPGRVHALSLVGGDPTEGEKIFRNQGACLQCHKVGDEGGIQGPELTLVGERLQPSKLLESLVNPSAEITPGYGLSNVTLLKGTSLVGRIAEKKDGIVTVIAPDGKKTAVREDQVKDISPPVSAMPPMGLTLSPNDLRNLIGFLQSRNKKFLADAEKADKHGE
jgi:quinoprotein glucose dehydrogenase